jgi:hypothetical protein
MGRLGLIFNHGWTRMDADEKMETGGTPVLRGCILLFMQWGFSTNRFCGKTYRKYLSGSG